MMRLAWRRLTGKTNGSGRRTRAARRLTGFERLEGRALMATAGVDYALAGLQWAVPSHVTYSIAPDGVYWDHGVNNLNAVFTGKFGSAWKAQIARALATWESIANINIGLTTDAPYDLDAPGLSQGDPRFGDIRFGGYAFTGDTTTLAQTYYPPPDGLTAAGDVEVNTAMAYNIGGDYDFFSVMLHETGHSLGLDHPSNPDVVMAARYHGVLSTLTAGDIAGIQAIYGARTYDAYQAAGQGLGFSSAINVTPMLNASGAAVLGNTSLATIGDTEYFSIVAPAGSGGTLRVTAATGTLSLLSPKVSLFDASGRLVDSQSNPAAWGNNVTATTTGVIPGQRYYVAVTGATSDVFAVGAYQLHVNFTTTAPTPTPTPPPKPIVSPPKSTTLPADRFEPNNTPAQATNLGPITQITIPGLSLNTTSDADDFLFQNARAGVYAIGAKWCRVQVLDRWGRVLATGIDQVQTPSLKAGTTLFVRITPWASPVVPDYMLTIAPSTAAANRKLTTAAADATSIVAEVPTPPQGWVHHWAWAKPRGR